jgi:phosphoribosylglycinamide formyltransferase-1
MGSEPLVLGVLASGRGSNLQAILDAIAAGRCPARVAVVVSDRKDAAALERARAVGVRAVHLDPRAYPDRVAFDDAVARVLDEHAVQLICLAGYMRVLSGEFVRRYRRRILNVHPALLPAFPGLHAQRQALEHGVKVAGATVHLVDEGVDTGPIVLQAAVPVLDQDTEATLADRILAEEHRLYPEAIRLYAEDRLEVAGRRVSIRPSAGRAPGTEGPSKHPGAGPG